MNYPVVTPMQLRAVLRALRLARGLTQEQAGKLLGVNQRRAAKIEGNPAVTSFGQVARLVAALGGRLVIEAGDAPQQAARTKSGNRAGGQAVTAKPAAGAKAVKPRGNW